MKVAVNKLVGIGCAMSLLFGAWTAFAQGETTTGAQASSTTSAVTQSAEGKSPGADVSIKEGSPAQTPTAAGGQVAPAESAAEADASAQAEESGELDGQTYQVRLRDLEQRVDELKEQIRRSHTRLSLLSDTILAGASGGGRAEIVFNNDLSGAWHVVEAVFVLDGAVQYKKTDDTGVLAKQTTIPIFSGSVPTGDHTLQVMLKLRGHGFGVFSYLRGIEATVRSTHSFTLSDGKVMELKATDWEKGGPTTPVEQQPDIRFNSTIRNLSDMPKAAPAKSSTPEQKPVDAQMGASNSTEKKPGGVSLGTKAGGTAEAK